MNEIEENLRFYVEVKQERNEESTHNKEQEPKKRD